MKDYKKILADNYSDQFKRLSWLDSPRRSRLEGHGSEERPMSPDPNRSLNGTADRLVYKRLGRSFDEHPLPASRPHDPDSRQKIATSIQTSVNRYQFTHKDYRWVGGNARRSLEKTLHNYRFTAEDYLPSGVSQLGSTNMTGSLKRNKPSVRWDSSEWGRSNLKNVQW